ncbi:MAG: alpha glucosidase [Rhodobacteraceae bacterium]|nr:alpha glucosidase [Paracoccaceae bacterium]
MSAASNSQLSGNPDWWRGAVIYQIYPRSYQDSTGNGVGDIKGITERLDHIKSLGVDAIWLSPFFTSPMKDFGYDVSDYCGVDPVFGTLDDFDVMVARAHDLGLRVMIDQVLSHSSDQHPWFGESRADKTNSKADWYVWADAKADGTPPNNWQSVFGGSAWTWDARRCQYYLHNFLNSQPDLNFHIMEVQDALLDTVRFWLERGVDGFRLDTVNFYVHNADLTDNPPADRSAGAGIDAPEVNPYGYQQHIHDKTQPENIPFLKRFRALLDSYPGAAAVGEVGDGSRSLQTMAEYTAGDDLLQMCYSFDMLGPKFSPEHFRGCVEAFTEASDRFADGTSWPCWAFSNHDVQRHMTRWAEHCDDPMQLAGFAVQLLTSLRGSVCIYQGEELGLPEADVAFEDLVDPYGITFWPEFKGRDGCRTPMVWTKTGPQAGFSDANKTWLPVPQEHLPLAVDQQAGQPASAMEQYRTHLHWRAGRPSLITGEITFHDAPEGALVFTRETEGEVTFCAFNLGAAPVTIPLPAEATPLKGVGFDGETLLLAPISAAFAEVTQA